MAIRKKPSAATNRHPDDDHNDGSIGPAIWLVPTVAVLFAIIGYVAQSAQESLLGVEFTDRSNSAYLNTAADFLRETITRLLTWPHDLLLGQPFLLPYTLIITAAAVTAAYSTRLRKRYANQDIVTIAALAILSCVVIKFVTMDAPLMRIENLVSQRNDSCWALVAQPTNAKEEHFKNQPEQPTLDIVANKSGTCPSIDAAKGVNAAIWSEAREIAGEIVCSRVAGEAAAKLPAAIAKSDACSKHDKETNEAALGDRFLSSVVLVILTTAGALVLLRRTSRTFAATASCLTTLFFGLTAPYTYGKVGITQLFDSGDARITQTLQASYRMENPRILDENGWLPGILLHKDQAGASILTMRDEPCGKKADGTPRGFESHASLSFISNTQLLSFDQISKVDVIYWLASQQANCPPL